MIEMVDEEFLSQVAAAEAEAISSTATKRRKVSQFTTTASVTAQKQNDVVKEGEYLAALKGSKSERFNQMNSNPRNNINKNNNNENFIKSNLNSNVSSDNTQGGISGGGGGNSCYKCGKLGHWARDCGAVGNDDFPDMECSCKRGYCKVYTSRKPATAGRKFYSCPVKKEDGGCNHFKWCDDPKGTDDITSHQNAVNHSVPEHPCPCGAGPCLILTTKSGDNIGRQYYKCPAVLGSCKFVKWYNDPSITASVKSSINSSQTYQNTSNVKNKSYNASNACYKCGKEGHWANDCQQLSSSSPADKIGNNASSGNCFKCHQPGHWAKDCQQMSSSSPADKSGKNASSGNCFKCDKPGHWARDCTSTSQTKPRFGR